MEEDKASYESLEQENQDFREQLDNIEKSKEFQKKAAKWTIRKIAGVFLGKGLKSAIKETFNEFNSKNKISTDTASNLGAHIIWRMTRIGLFAIIFAILPISFLAIQTVYLGKQNDKIEKQNELITAQNNRLEQQTYLQEAGRRSSLVFLSNNVLDRMDDELKDAKNKDRNLSDQLIGRIIALSKSLKPYKYLENDSLSMTVSPERGQLLVNLTKAKLGEKTYVKIFEDADFSFSEVSNLTFNNINFGNINLSNSVLKEVSFTKCKFGNIDLSKSLVYNFTIRDSFANKINLKGSFTSGIFFFNIVSEFINMDLSFIDFIRINESSIGYLSFYESYISGTLQFAGTFIVKFNFELNNGKLKSYFNLTDIEKYKLWETFEVEESEFDINGAFFFNILLSENTFEKIINSYDMIENFQKLLIHTRNKKPVYDSYFLSKNIVVKNDSISITFKNLEISKQSIVEESKSSYRKPLRKGQTDSLETKRIEFVHAKKLEFLNNIENYNKAKYRLYLGAYPQGEMSYEFFKKSKHYNSKN